MGNQQTQDETLRTAVDSTVKTLAGDVDERIGDLAERRDAMLIEYGRVLSFSLTQI